MPRISPPGHIPEPREPEVVLDVAQRATVKAWIQAYVIAEDKSLKYEKVALETIKYFKESLGILPKPIVLGIVEDVDKEWKGEV